MTSKLLLDNTCYTDIPTSSRYEQHEINNRLGCTNWSFTSVPSKHNAVLVFVTGPVAFLLPANDLASRVVGYEIVGPALLCTLDQLPV